MPHLLTPNIFPLPWDTEHRMTLDHTYLPARYAGSRACLSPSFPPKQISAYGTGSGTPQPKSRYGRPRIVVKARATFEVRG